MKHSSRDIATVFSPHFPVRMGRIRYINVAPVYFGLDNGLRPSWIELVNAPPAGLNHMLAQGLLDISPVSSAAFARNRQNWRLLPGCCIACRGEVMSVLLVSGKSFESLDSQRILVTEESASAAALLKLLFAMEGIHPEFQIASVENPPDVTGRAGAALVIGDTALTWPWRDFFPHCYDLGALWTERTGLPFVFAVWAVREEFAQKYPDTVDTVAELLNTSKGEGIKNLELISKRSAKKTGLPADFCRKYYSRLNYDLDAPEFSGLRMFFDYMHRYRLLENTADADETMTCA